jgi:hypothetical protein
MVQTWIGRTKGRRPVIMKARGTSPVTASPAAMSSLRDDNHGQVRARWNGTNEVNPRGCHVAFDQ